MPFPLTLLAGWAGGIWQWTVLVLLFCRKVPDSFAEIQASAGGAEQGSWVQGGLTLSSVTSSIRDSWTVWRQTSEPNQEKDRDDTTLTTSGLTPTLLSFSLCLIAAQVELGRKPRAGEGSSGSPVHKSTLHWWWLGLKSDKLHAHKKQSRKRRAFKTFNRETKQHYTKITSSPFACNPQG